MPPPGRRSCPSGSSARPASRSRCSRWAPGPCANTVSSSALIRQSYARVSARSTPPRLMARARLQEVARAGSRCPQGDRPGHQGQPARPKDLLAMLDRRLEALSTDYIDLFFIHGMGDDHGLDAAINFVKSQEFKETAEAIRKSGKAKFLGFSTHHRDRAAIIQAAAEGGIVDAIMLQYTPWLDKDAPLNKALDACHAKGIGLISMKQVAGQFLGAPKINVLEEVVRRAPMLAEKKLTPYQGLLHAIWTDERISGSCVSIKTTDQLREDADAARRYEPMKTAEIEQLRDAAGLRPDALRRLRRPMLGRRRHQGRAGRPDAVPHLLRAPWHPRRGAPPVRRTGSRGPRLVRRRPRGRSRRLPQQAGLRPAPPQGRSAPGLKPESTRSRIEGRSRESSPIGLLAISAGMNDATVSPTLDHSLDRGHRPVDLGRDADRKGQVGPSTGALCRVAAGQTDGKNRYSRATAQTGNEHPDAALMRSLSGSALGEPATGQ